MGNGVRAVVLLSQTSKTLGEGSYSEHISPRGYGGWGT